MLTSGPGASAPLPRFPRGFILGAEVAPPTYEPGPLLPDLYVHPWLNVELSETDNEFVMILGICVSSDPSETGGAAAALLGALRESPERLLKEIGHYVGRYAIIFGTPDAPKVVTDATAMRSVYYSEEGGIVASHALLVEQALGNRERRMPFPFQYGFPGSRTPHRRTKLLTPNTYLDAAAGTVHRFWPARKIEPREVEEVASEALTAAVTSLRRAADGRPLKVAMTAGLDSRVVLAIALEAGIPFQAYTYQVGETPGRDILLARDLSAQFGITHKTAERLPLSRELSGRLSEAHFSAHHVRVVPGLMDWFDDPSSVAMSANTLEIGRSFFHPMRAKGVAEPTSAETMTELHYRRMGKPVQQAIAEFGEDLWREFAHSTFNEYINDTDHATTAGLIDPFDLFYWEHRMAAWHGTAMVERDFYAEAFIPFNSRDMFEAMLGIEHADRRSGAVLYKLVEMVEPALLHLPVNPRRWPDGSAGLDPAGGPRVTR